MDLEGLDMDVELTLERLQQSIRGLSNATDALPKHEERKEKTVVSRLHGTAQTDFDAVSGVASAGDHPERDVDSFGSSADELLDLQADLKSLAQLRNQIAAVKQLGENLKAKDETIACLEARLGDQSQALLAEQRRSSELASRVRDLERRRGAAEAAAAAAESAAAAAEAATVDAEARRR
ncbi:unnamed protein product, partial [Phaeothamnion confervicola]